jgi:hypothetical protein
MKIPMRSSAATLVIAVGLLGTGCISSNQNVVKTQVVTFPDGAIVEYNGQRMGRAPAQIILPQDEHGRLTERAVVRIIPNTDQPTLYAQHRVFEPGERMDRVPNRVLVDMTLAGTNTMASVKPSTTHVEKNSRESVRPSVPYVNRGKPTQAVGLDRWKPGIY